MKSLFVWLNRIIRKHKAMKRWQRIVTVLAAIMTFVTTYALILPAITVERNKVEDVGGMYLEHETDTNDMLEENALEPTGVIIAADNENAVSFSYADDEIEATAIISTDEEIPEGAELVVNPVIPESEEYADLSSRSAALLDKEFIYDVTTCSFYDFALVYDNVDVTPETGLVDIQINFHNNTVEHVDDMLFAGRYAKPASEEGGFVAMSTDNKAIDTVEPADALISVNPDESQVIELTDGVITGLSLKGNDLAESDSLVGVLAGSVDEEIKAAAAETDADVPDSNDVEDGDSAAADTEEAAQVVKTLEFNGSDYSVILTYDGTSKIPEGAVLTASEIRQNSDLYMTYLEETKRAMGLKDEDTLPRLAARFFDIKIMVGEEEFTPKSGVSVEITYAEPLAENPDTEVSAVHFAGESADAEVIEANTTDVRDDGAATVEFTAESFSVYGVIYTVDFHWEVDGKMYEFSLPGGGFVSFSKLAEVLGIISDKNSEENVDQNESETAEIEKESDTASSLTLGDVMVSDAAREFAADVESVEFSSPELVDVSRVENDTTVGQIKEVRGLQVQYSAELTQEQIEEINAQTVEAGDWALISVQPFTSEETMTVTMKDGEVFTIQVTDYQISTNVLTADGRNYKITVTYDDNAEIPSGTKLTAEEIMPGTDEYLQHLGKAWAEVNKDYLAQEEEKQKNIDGLDEYEDIRPVNLDDARFFNIRLIYGEKEIEPKAPVHVDIEYVEGFTTVEVEEDQVIGVAHYKKDETELITDVRTEKNEAGEIVEFVYEQDSFSDIGTYVGQKTYDNVPYKMSKALAMPLLRALTNATRNGTQLKDIEAHKKLTNNDDGTYTMSLTVKGDSVANEEYNKANILFVMDRSSSMTSNNVYQEYTDTTYPSGTTYYRKNGNNYEELFLNNGQVCTRAWSGGMFGSWDYTPYTGTVYTSVTRLVAEQAAMDVLIQNLLGKNDSTTPGKEDLIEISVISFAEDRQSGDTEYTEWTSNDYDGLMEAVNQTNTPSGTNWEDALIYAREQAYIKKSH